MISGSWPNQIMAVEKRKRWMRRSSAWQAGLAAWATYRVSGSRNRPTPPT